MMGGFFVRSNLVCSVHMSVKLPKEIWHMKGSEGGLKVVVLGGTHGDELAGIEIVRRLREKFGLAEKGGGTYETDEVHGDLYFGLGNPEAVKRGARAAADGPDLNRSFFETDLILTPSDDDRPDLVRARELAPLLAQADFLIDLHGTNTDSLPFVCLNGEREAHQRLYRHLDVEYVLSDPDKILAQDEQGSGCGTTDEYVEAYGGAAIVYETGKGSDVSGIDKIYKEVLAMLQELKILGGDVEGNKGPKDDHTYAITHNVIAKATDFTYARGMDKGWRKVMQGELIGTYGDGTEEHAPDSGIVLLQRAPEKIVVGKFLYFLAK